MKKRGILNTRLSGIIAAMGHTDKLVIGDSGLPVPRNKELVDLALTLHIPRFVEVLRSVLEDLQVESAIIASEMTTASPDLFAEVQKILGAIPVQQVPHEQFKKICREESNIAFVRTGEATPFANIILISGVVF